MLETGKYEDLLKKYLRAYTRGAYNPEELIRTYRDKKILKALIRDILSESDSNQTF